MPSELHVIAISLSLLLIATLYQLDAITDHLKSIDERLLHDEIGDQLKSIERLLHNEVERQRKAELADEGRDRQGRFLKTT